MSRSPSLPHRLGLIGLGAFGAFARPLLARHVDVVAHDPARPGPSLAAAAACPVVILAVPLAALAEVARAIAPLLEPGALVIDVCSVKSAPLALLDAILPDHADIVGTHPLFGPQSGRDGIAGLPVAICPARRGRRQRLVSHFLAATLALDVVVLAAEEHDREMATVQGLTHLLARIVLEMGVGDTRLATPTFRHLLRMVDTVRHDSDALFRTVLDANPHAAAMRAQFREAAQRVEARLAQPVPAMA
ncbi:MAG: prephenate dehydrogenase [Rhodospirillales bacterium]|nr:prephenate dehydrogenase [Rhodospirillales bacterium]